ncbi:608_t:CDS:2, partial [Acaulospora morrowiae]
AAINCLSNTNPMKLQIIQIYNIRYQEFDYEAYLLSYYLHPLYRGYGLKDKMFQVACITAGNYWKALGHDQAECNDLLREFRKYKRREDPYDMEYDPSNEFPLAWWLTFNDKSNIEELAVKMFSIVPSQVSCERNFSILKWFYSDRRNRLNIKHIESMAKLRSFWLLNIRNELTFYGKNLSEQDLRNYANTSIIQQFSSSQDSYYNEESVISQSTELSTNQLLSNQLEIANIVNLSLLFFESDELKEPNWNKCQTQLREIQREGSGIMDFEIIDLTKQILDEEITFE